MLRIDGSEGEGGGQVLRTALSLSALTGTPVELIHVRARRPNPGLGRQHLACVQAAAAICGAEVGGAEQGSRHVFFRPGPVQAGRYRFTVGTAGSANLVLQTVLPPLAHAGGDSEVEVEGGTHNPAAPTSDDLARGFAPRWNEVAPPISVQCPRRGFFPRGGGRVRLEVGSGRFQPAHWLTRGPLRWSGEVLLADLPEHIAKREKIVVRQRMGLDHREVQIVACPGEGPGNVLALEAVWAGGCARFNGFGEKGVHAERVAQGAVDQALAWSAADVPIDAHLADQLLIPLALAGGGSFRTTAPTLHFTTQASLLSRFLPVAIAVEEQGGGAFLVTVSPAREPQRGESE